MLKNRIIACAVLAAFFATPIAVSAEETPKVSYSAKKQGRVVFQDMSQDENNNAQSMRGDEINPADIEPAAGGFEPENDAQENSLADSMKLPRKN